MNQFTSIGKNMMIADKYFKLYLKNELLAYDLNTAQGIVLLMMYQKLANQEKSNSSIKESDKESNHTDSASTENQNEIMVQNTQDELIKELHYDKGVMTRTMKELESKGFVTREQNPTDSRSYLFSLTQKGLDFKEPLLQILQKWNARLLAGLTTKELTVVEKALTTMSKNASMFYNSNDET